MILGRPSNPARRVLFLQGVASSFFSEFGSALAKKGHAVFRINFSLGDRIFWKSSPAHDYRGTRANWDPFIRRYLRENDITDLVLFGDCREMHRVAIKAAREQDLNILVFDEGYLRPDWITFEQDGVNGFSKLPRDAGYYLKMAHYAARHHRPKEVAGGMYGRVANDILWNVLTLLSSPFYGGYRSHRPHNPLVEYASWVVRLLKSPKNGAHAREVVRACTVDAKTTYLLALQLESDYQIRVHSDFNTMEEVMEVTIASFAEHAPAETRLLIKNHPLDNGLVDHRSNVTRLAAKHGVSSRVGFIDGGHLPTLLDHVRGLIVVNSTVGLSGIHHRCPTFTLGDPVYDIPGLTFQGSLHDFWTRLTIPDERLYLAFRRVVIYKTQLNGSFYTKNGIPIGVAAAVRRLEALPSPTKEAPKGGAS